MAYTKKNKVIISGCGCIGLTMACLLARENIDVVLFRDSPYKDMSRLFAVSSGSCEILELAGVTCSENWSPINGILINQYSRNVDLFFNPKESGFENYGYMIEEKVLYNALFNAASQYPNINITDNAISDVIEADFNSNVFYLDGSESCDLLIIAEGANSKLRELMQFPVKKMPYRQKALMFNIKHSKNHSGIAFELFLDEGSFAILPRKNNKSSTVVWSVESSIADTICNAPSEILYEMVSERCKSYLENIEIDSDVKSFSLNLVHAKIPYKNRSVLIGDSYHSIHPIAGQGLNLGLRDINTLFNLIKQNLYIGADIGSTILLKQYYNMRKLDVELMICAMNFSNQIFRTPILKNLAPLGMSIIHNNFALKSLITNYASR